MKVNYDLKGIGYDRGYQTLKNNGIALLGISPGNTYYKQSIISELIDVATTIFSKIYIVIPDKPHEHTYKAIGYADAEAQRRARKASHPLKKSVDTAKENVTLKTDIPLHCFDWQTEIEASPCYQDKLDYIYTLYHGNKEFHDDIHNEVKHVIINYPHKKQETITESMLMEGAQYMLKEFAFFSALPDMVQTDTIALVYHREWPLWEKFSNGFYGQEILKIGLIIIS